LIARNLVPVGGALFLGWSAPNLLVLYFIDTLLAFGSVLLLVAAHVTGLGAVGDTRRLRTAGDWLRGGFGTTLATLLIGLPLGVPLFILLAEFDWAPLAAFADRSFAAGLLMQVGLSVSGFVQAHRELLAREDDERILKHRVAFIVARWGVVLFVAMSGLPGMLGPWIGGILVLVAYAGATICFELFPGSALAWINPREAAKDARSDDEAANRTQGRRRPGRCS
jgi:hypothetical protein